MTYMIWRRSWASMTKTNSTRNVSVGTTKKSTETSWMILEERCARSATVGDDADPGSARPWFRQFGYRASGARHGCGGAPGRVGVAHLADERLHVAWDSWPPGPTRPTLPAPVEPKPKAMPPEDRVGLDDDKRVPPSGPQATEPRPEQPIDWSQPRSPVSPSLQDRQLMTQRDVFDLEAPPGPAGPNPML